MMPNKIMMDIEEPEDELCPNIIKGDKLGEGTYGVVYKGTHKLTGEVYAIKKVKLEREDEGIPSTTLREIALLKTLKHPNIVYMQNMYYSQESRKLHMLFEFLDRDLRKYIDTFTGPLPLLTVKAIMYQILQGLSFCHTMRVLHRDLKPQNLLISKEGRVKIADFGLARTFSQPFKKYTKDTVTLWYRAPEILLGTEKYAVEIDMWSVGCIFGELINRRPLFMGDCQIDQLYKIFRFFGTPTETTWPGISSLPNYTNEFPKFKPKGPGEDIQTTDADARELFGLMMKMNPVERISARKALEHSFFDDVKRLPSIESAFKKSP